MIKDYMLGKALDLIIKFAEDKTDNNLKIAILLNKLGLLNKDKTDFQSIYTYALVNYGISVTNQDLIKYFADQEVADCFKKKLYIDKEEKFIEILDSRLHTGQFLGLKCYQSLNELKPEIEKFKQMYEAFNMQVTNPILYEMYINQKQESFKKSFEYQIEQYHQFLIDKFDKDFSDNKYIQQKGELSKYIILSNNMSTPGFFKKSLKYGKKNRSKKLRNYRYTGLRGLGGLTNSLLGNVDIEVELLNPIDDYIFSWINKDDQNFLVILGEYGTGKTSLCKHIAKELSLSKLGMKETIIDNDNRKVILLNLRDFKAEDIEKFIIAELHENGIREFSIPDLYNRIDKKELIFIFDGFDEMPHNAETNQKKENFFQIEKLIKDRPNSKVILTSREEYFTYDDEINEVFENEENDNYQIIHLNLFDDDQIKAYLASHSKNPEFYLEKIKDIYDLKDLAARPVLLEFVIKHLPKILEKNSAKGFVEHEIQINASDLYKAGIDYELSKKNREAPFLRKTLPTPKRLLLLQRLCLWMYENDTLSIDTREIVKTLNMKKYFDVKVDYEVLQYLNLFLNFTFLIKESDYSFRISHKSFRDYLTAKELVFELNNGNIDVFGSKPITSEIVHFIAEQNPDEEYLDYLRTTDEEVVVNSKWAMSNAVNLLLKVHNSGCNVTNDYSKNKVILKDNNIVNLSALSRLNQLEYLDLQKNRITDLSKLKKLQNLSYLKLYKNRIDRTEFLEGLTSLLYLDLSKNKISDINSLAGLSKIEELNLHSNNINDLSVLDGFSVTLEHLEIGINPIDNFDPISNLGNLKTLNLYKTKVSKLDFIMKLEKLVDFRAPMNCISDISPISFCLDLQVLDLNKNNIKDLNPLSELYSLERLYLGQNEIEDIESLKNLTNLNRLRISKNNIKDLSPLYAMKDNLSVLRIDNNPIDKDQVILLRKKLPNTKIISDFDEDNLRDIEDIYSLMDL